MDKPEQDTWVVWLQLSIADLAARQVIVWTLEHLAHPLYPERMPRKVKKAAKKALPEARARLAVAKASMTRAEGRA